MIRVLDDLFRVDLLEIYDGVLPWWVDGGAVVFAEVEFDGWIRPAGKHFYLVDIIIYIIQANGRKLLGAISKNCLVVFCKNIGYC